ncbi:E3 ubiquitin-protein ligase Topors-like [Meleagris gallopavo]|nr:E3 ubiquitin-protein ligase Topors-like [Meleagris gallopavo]
MPLDAPTDSRCPMCLDRFESIVYLDPCWHKFCFRCIREWSKFKADCPLCQQPFFSLCHTVHAEDDIARSSENESFSYSDLSSINFTERISDLEAWDQHANYDYPTPSHNEESSSDSTVADFPDEVNSQEREHGSSEHSVDWLSSNDETPGPSYSSSEEYNAAITSSELVESSNDDSLWERTTLQPQLQVSVDSGDSNSSLEYHDISDYVYADRTPELTVLSSDSEDSIRERKREDTKKEQSIQGSSLSDRESQRASTPFPLYKEHVSSCQSPLLSVKRIMSKDEQKNKDHSPHDSDWSLPLGMENAYSPRSQRLSRKRKTRSPQSSEDSHDYWPRKKHYLVKYPSKKRLPESRQCSKYWSKISRWSRLHDRSPTLKGQTESSSCESSSSRDSSRSWLYHKGYGQRKSSSLDKDCSYRRLCYQSSYLLHSPKTVGEGSSCSKSTQPEAHCSSKSPSLEFRSQSSTKMTDLQSQIGFHERQDSCYKQRRSRSRSSSRSRSPPGEADRTKSEKPGGKRKCKTRHLENTEKESTSMVRKKDFPTFSGYYKIRPISAIQESSEIKHEEKSESMGSTSMEGVYEGTETMKCALKKKCKKKHQEHHWKDA